MSTTRLDFDARYHVAGYEGVAFYLLGYVKDDKTDCCCGDPDCGADHDRVSAVMVGDDRVHLLEVSDLTKLEDHEYCPSCGQIGCGAGA